VECRATNNTPRYSILQDADFLDLESAIQMMNANDARKWIDRSKETVMRSSVKNSRA